LVGRAMGPIYGGEELTISYGEHDEHVFALYYDFVMGWPSTAAWAAHQRWSQRLLPLGPSPLPRLSTPPRPPPC
jgi:hypothetical protein